ncbi:TonB-dependent receptor [Sphingopyxis granuli]|uniref:TonB-dependent receptor n=1 Tax=Sphingopyxis granuli TaxID=267128 RepID=A0AA86GM57_9SPHN|nr:TonB-dependent receptor [Sphingopyxis granuli]AMG75567.1 TonB-dependent receptor [Sphingopyxis granuli]
MKYKILAAMLASSTATIAIQAPTAQAQTQTERRSYDIAAQDLGAALRSYSQISGREVVASSTIVAGKRSTRVQGRLNADAALSRLLSGTGLVAELVDGALVVREGNEGAAEAGSTDASGEAIIVTGSRIRGVGPTGSPIVTIDREAIEKSGYGTVQQMLQSLPQAFGGGSNETTTGATTRNGTGNDATLGSSINLRGLGTNSTLVLIDGARPALGGVGGLFADISLIPMTAVERIEVLTDGASAIYGADAVAGVVNLRLRNRFEGGETILRAGTADGDMTEVQFSQLLGKKWSGGHLVLAYQYSDRGALAAAERDFAREDLRPFGGPDYRSIYASPGTIRAANGQLFGIPAGQNGRSLTAAQLLPGVQNRRDNRAETDILPRQRVHSLYAAGEFEITGGLTFRASILGAQRKYRKETNVTALRTARVPVTNPFYVDPIGTRQPVQVTYNFVNDVGPQINEGRVRALSASAGLEQTIGEWRIHVGGAYGVQKGKARTLNQVNSARLAVALADTNPATSFNVFGDGSANNPATIDYIRGGIETIDDFKTWSAALRADGPLFRLPAGDVRLAAGAEYRREAYDYYRILDTSTLTPSAGFYPGFPGPRHVKSIYAELLVPIFGPDNAMPGFHKLDLTLAGRIEDYNQFGRTENPKISARWEPIEGIAVRASYGTSFRAPQFDELIGPALSLYTTATVPDPRSPTGTSNVLALFGYAPNIQPEKATTWTAGFDIAPRSMPGLRASLTYFDVDYRDRIGTLTEDYLRFLTNLDVFGGVVTDNPSLDLVQFYYNQPTFTNPINIAPGQVVAILDGQTRNLAREHQEGIDFEIGYAPELAGGTLDLGVSGTHIFSIRKQLSPGSVSSDFVGLYASPVKWRMRGRLGWSKGGFAASAFVNYTDGYKNQVVIPNERVSAWTTVDLTLSQRIGGNAADASGRGLQLGLAIQNLFDRDPPYVNNKSQTSALGYDPEKASPLGRMISVQAVVRW